MSGAGPPVPAAVEGRPRVLVVEDDRAQLTTMEAILADEFEVSPASSPERGLELAAGQAFDVVCSDYLMPGMDGLTFFERLGALALPPPPQCLLITGAVEYVDRKIHAHREIHALIKPYEPAKLIHMIMTLARMQGMKRQMEGQA